jgi:hypothetical protein
MAKIACRPILKYDKYYFLKEKIISKEYKMISETCQSKKKKIKRIKIKFDRKKKLKQDEIIKTKIKQFRK